MNITDKTTGTGTSDIGWESHSLSQESSERVEGSTTNDNINQIDDRESRGMTRVGPIDLHASI